MAQRQDFRAQPLGMHSFAVKRACGPIGMAQRRTWRSMRQAAFTGVPVPSRKSLSSFKTKTGASMRGSAGLVAVLSGSVSYVEGQAQNADEQLRVADLPGDRGDQPEGLERYRTRKHKLPGADLKNERPCRLGQIAELRDPADEEIRPRFGVTHRESSPHLAPKPQIFR